MPHSVSVKDYMADHLVTFTPDMDLQAAVDALLEKGISGAPVIDKLGNIVGILSERDCLKVTLNASYYGEKIGKVADFMTTQVKTIEIDTSILEVAKLFLEHPYRRYPVVDDNRLVGQISRRDVLRALQRLWQAW